MFTCFVIFLTCGLIEYAMPCRPSATAERGAAGRRDREFFGREPNRTPVSEPGRSVSRPVLSTRHEARRQRGKEAKEAKRKRGKEKTEYVPRVELPRRRRFARDYTSQLKLRPTRLPRALVSFLFAFAAPACPGTAFVRAGLRPACS